MAAFILIALPFTDAAAQTLANNFTNRVVIANPLIGQINGNNTTATFEPLEPRHAGKIGGKSLWISWIAPSNGIVKFQTEASGFDTLLAAYCFASTNDTALDQLIPLVSADDSEGYGQESEIEFGVTAGQRIEIAVDGYYGAAGAIELQWKFESTPLPPPVILSSTGDRAVDLGAPLTLGVNLTSVSNALYKWFLNGNELDHVTTNVFIPSMQATNVGRYRLRLDVAGVRYFSQPIEIQINTDGANNALARDKIFDAFGSPLTPGFAGGGFAAKGASDAGDVVRGYNGSQIFNTTFATVDPAEPAHCGVTNGASYWFAYEAPTNGTVTLDTLGSSYDTVLTAYAFNAPLTNYADLMELACDDNSAVTNGAAQIQFALLQGRQYAIVVTGVNGARGIARLNYRMDPLVAPVPPTLQQPALAQNVAAGASVNLEADVTGSAPLRFRWLKGGTPIPGATNAQLGLANVTPIDSANYVLVVSNHVGAPLNVSLPMQVIVTPAIQFSAPMGSDELTLAFSTATNRLYTIEHADNVTGPWTPLGTSFFGSGSDQFLTNGFDAERKFFRIRVE